MIADRSNHKLTEWRTFCDVVKALPYMEQFVSCLKDSKKS